MWPLDWPDYCFSILLIIKHIFTDKPSQSAPFGQIIGQFINSTFDLLIS
jgi:hypothetical protein